MWRGGGAGGAGPPRPGGGGGGHGLLGGVVAVQRGVADPGAPGDVLDARRVIAQLGEARQRGVEDLRLARRAGHQAAGSAAGGRTPARSVLVVSSRSRDSGSWLGRSTVGWSSACARIVDMVALATASSGLTPSTWRSSSCAWS